MPNADIYLDMFKAIERHLRQITRSGREVPFYALVDAAARIDSAVRRYRDDLKEFADLRNAIVHERGGGQPIADPNDWAIDRLKMIAEQLIHPPRVHAYFVHPVIQLRADDPIAEAVCIMYRNSFSQLPVYDGDRFGGLLTSNTVTRWLGASVADDIFSLRETPIRKVLEHTEFTDHVAFVARDATLAEVVNGFLEREAHGRHLDAMLITHSGQETEKLLGIITVYDLVRINQLLVA